MTSSRNQLLRVTVTPVRNRKPKANPDLKTGALAYADKLLELLHDPNIVYLQEQDIFASIIASAVQDLHKVK